MCFVLLDWRLCTACETLADQVGGHGRRQSLIPGRLEALHAGVFGREIR